MCAPRTEWVLVSNENAPSWRLLGGYVAPLAALAVLVPLLRPAAHAPFVSMFLRAALLFSLQLVGVSLLAEVINVMAPFFGGVSGRREALKVAAYSLTPFWLARILFSPLNLDAPAQLGAVLYGTYLLYLGVGKLMKAPRAQSFGYATTILLCAILLGMVLTRISAGVAGTAYLGPFRGFE